MAMSFVTHVSSAHIRDFPTASTMVIDPTDSDCVDQGEWVAIDSDGNLEMADSNSPNAYPVFSQKGSTDGQVLKKLAVVMSRDVEINTSQYNTSLTYAIGDRVTVDKVTVDSVERSLLTTAAGAASDYIYGTVTLDPDNNDDLLRVHIQAPVLNT